MAIPCNEIFIFLGKKVCKYIPRPEKSAYFKEASLIKVRKHLEGGGGGGGDNNLSYNSRLTE